PQTPFGDERELDSGAPMTASPVIRTVVLRWGRKCKVMGERSPIFDPVHPRPITMISTGAYQGRRVHHALPVDVERARRVPLDRAVRRLPERHVGAVAGAASRGDPVADRAGRLVAEPDDALVLVHAIARALLRADAGPDEVDGDRHHVVERIHAGEGSAKAGGLEVVVHVELGGISGPLRE